MSGNTNPNAKGVATSEFWVTVLSVLAGLGVATGHLTPDAANPLVAALAALGGSLVVIFTSFAYVNGRIELKKSILGGGSSTTNTPTP